MVSVTSVRRRDRRVLLLAAVVVAGAVLVGVRTITNRETPDAAAPPVPVRPPPDPVAASSGPATAAPVPAGPVAEDWGVPIGYVSTPAGARAAAVGWVSSLGTLMEMGPIARADTLRALLTEQAAAETIGEFRGERDRYVEEFAADPSEAMWLESPLTVNVDAFDESVSTVRVWSQLIVGIDGERVAVLWRTHTVTLVWERDDWRVDDVTRVPGPTPITIDGELPTPASEFTDPAQWTPAVLAGSDIDGEEGDS